MSTLEDSIRNIQRTIISIEDRIRVLEGKAHKAATNQVSQESTVEAPNPNPYTSNSPSYDVKPPQINIYPLPPKSSTSTKLAPTFKVSEPVDSSTLLGAIGILFVILAGVFFIRLTIESGWLTPERQVFLGLGAGLVMFFLPHLLPAADREYGGLLSGAGIAILHLSWFGAYTIHDLINAKTALVCATLVGILSLLGRIEKGAIPYILVAMIGTYLAIPLVGYKTQDMPTMSIFLLIWNISFVIGGISIRRREIIFIASYLGALTVLILSLMALKSEQHLDLLRLQVLQFIVFAVGLIVYSYNEEEPMTNEQSFALFPVLLIYTSTTNLFVKHLYPEFSPWFGTLVGVALLAVYFIAKKSLNRELPSGEVLTSFAALSIVYSLFFQVCSAESKPIVGLIAGMAVMGLWRVFPDLKEKFFWPGIFVLTTFLVGAVLTLESKGNNTIFFMNFAYGITALLAIVFNRESNDESKIQISNIKSLLLGFAHFEVLLGLYRFSEQAAGSSSLMLTVSWGIYALIVLSLGYYRQDRILGNSALMILLAVSMKALFYDTRESESLIRVVCLLAEGLLLYGCGLVFKRFKQWN